MNVVSEPGSLRWIRLAPIFGGLAVVAALLAILLPGSQNIAVLALVFFGMVMLYACIVAAQKIGQQEADAEAAVTRAQYLEREVARHREALDDLADGLDVAILLVDTSTRILYANKQTGDLFRFAEPIGSTILAVTLSNEVVALINAAIANKEPQRAEVTFRHPEERVGIVQAWPEQSSEDRLFVSIYDITTLRRLERVRRDFVANVSHELRTPMTTIRAMAETLEEEEEAPDRELHAKYLAKIIREVDRLTRITDDLLTLSSIESEHAIKVPCDAAEIMRSVVQQLQRKAQEKGLTLNITTPPHIEIMANETQFSQIILNLVDNAINYTTEGQIDVTATTSDGELTISVKDTGIGIASEHVPRIFERFYRVDKGRSRATGGTGLGLSIVRNIVEGHGGRLSVDSALHHGSTFTVTLPLRPR